MPLSKLVLIDGHSLAYRAFYIPAVSAEGHEADDVLGTLATRAAV